MDEADDGAHILRGDLQPLGRAAYLVLVLPLLAAMYAPVVWLRLVAYRNMFDPPVAGAWLLDRMPEVLGIALGVWLLAGTTAVGWLSARRAAANGAPEGAVVASIVPWIQLLAVPVLAFSREHPELAAGRLYPSLRAALWGLALAVGAEIVCTLIFGLFGMTLFVAAPFLVGFVAAWIAVREGDPNPLVMGQGALIVASAVLFGFAFEGLFCLAVIYPLAVVAALIGGAVGMTLARWRTPRATLMSSVALMPLLLAAELAEPPMASFADTRSVEVAAAPAAVWQAIVDMGAIEQPPPAPFGWGLAYPVAGHIEGEGVGAVRRGVFSTGVAYERVTRWEKDRALWFDVLSDPPMMRETNPFGPVRAAHLDGYFLTHDARFRIEPLPGGRSRLTLATRHTLKVGPSTYFLPLARWAVTENKRRVLAHFRDRAEGHAGQ